MLGTDIPDNLLRSCAQLFSTNYGKWGEKAITISRFTKPGQAVVCHLGLFVIAKFIFQGTLSRWQSVN